MTWTGWRTVRQLSGAHDAKRPRIDREPLEVAVLVLKLAQTTGG
jgi:hypothetical protein